MKSSSVCVSTVRVSFQALFGTIGATLATVEVGVVESRKDEPPAEEHGLVESRPPLAASHGKRRPSGAGRAWQRRPAACTAGVGKPGGRRPGGKAAPELGVVDEKGGVGNGSGACSSAPKVKPGGARARNGDSSGPDFCAADADSASEAESLPSSVTLKAESWAASRAACWSLFS